jgi:hypothetical protein
MNGEMPNLLPCLAFSCAVILAQQGIGPESRPRSEFGPNGHTLIVIHGGEFTMGSPTRVNGGVPKRRLSTV